MLGYSMVHLLGNLGNAPEMRTTTSGETVTKFSLAVNEKWTGADGQKNERVNWFECEAWGKVGQNIAQYVDKGFPLFVSGRLRHETWEDKEDGSKRSKVKVIVDGMRLLTNSLTKGKNRDDNGDTDNPPASVTHPKPTAKPKAVPTPEPVSEDDIPF